MKILPKFKKWVVRVNPIKTIIITTIFELIIKLAIVFLLKPADPIKVFMVIAVYTLVVNSVVFFAIGLSSRRIRGLESEDMWNENG